MAGTLYLVATPIGNLKDITLRALDVLKEVDLIACEDTRHSKKLMAHYGISKKLVSFHEHNETQRTDELIKLVAEGSSIAVISDAGTPGICDPGFRLVRRAQEAGLAVVPIPGPAAFVSALVVSGIDGQQFYFGGFLPSKKSERRLRLQEAAAIPHTLVFYETPHRIDQALRDCLDILGNQQMAIVRELTKLHEEVITGSAAELVDISGKREIKGEIVLIVDNSNPQKTLNTGDATILQRLEEIESEGIDRKSALKKAAKEFGISRSEAFRQVQLLKKRPA